jgi:hypothetical protein
MKNLKSVAAAVIFSVLTFIAGCSDQIISPVSQSNGPDKVTSSGEAKTKADVYHTVISLKPRQVYTFDSQNTIFKSFNSISVLNCGDTKSGIEIFGYSNDAVMVLGCNSKDFYAYSITVENRTSASVDLDVFLTGSNQMVVDPWQIEKELY